MLKSIIIKELKLIAREKGNFFFLIGMPIMFIVLFGSIFGNSDTTFTIPYIDHDQSEASKTFLGHLEGINGFEIERVVADEHEQVEQIKAGKIASLLVIPENFEENLNSGGTQVGIQFYRDPAEAQTVAPIQTVLENIANIYREQKMSIALTGAGFNEVERENIMQAPINIEEINTSTKQVDAISQYVPGYTVMFVFFIMITMVRRFFKERESGMVARMQSTPLHPLVYLIGMWVPAFISVIIQCTVLLAFGHFVYGLDLGNLFAISTIIICLAICGTGLGLAMAICVTGENQGLALTQVISLGGAVLAGLWFPFEMLPSFARAIGYFTPQYWAQTGLQDVMVRGANVDGVWQGLLVLIGYGALGVCIALWRFKHFIKTAIS